MRTVEEIKAELEKTYIHHLGITSGKEGKKRWKETAIAWVRLFEGEFAEAVEAEGKMGGGQYYSEMPFAHVHHHLCRHLATEIVGPVPRHPTQRPKSR